LNPAVSALVWLVVASLGLAVSFLPRSVEMRVGPWLGRLAYHLDPKRRTIAFDNIRRCLPELGPRGWRKLLKENYDHYGILALEILHMFSPIPGHYRRYATRNSAVDNLDVFKRLDALGKGTIAVTGHFANWEMMGAATFHGVKPLVTGKTVKPAWLNEKLFAARLALNVRTASGKRILPEILRWIKSGRTGTFILDQYAAPPSGVPVEFFGVTVDTQGVVGLVSQRTGAPIFTIFTRRDKKGIIHAVFQEVVPTKEELEDPLKMT
jgi:Kdo2-lipid IVA lauroyltransferase/acyltransferase